MPKTDSEREDEVISPWSKVVRTITSSENIPDESLLADYLDVVDKYKVIILTSLLNCYLYILKCLNHQCHYSAFEIASSIYRN